jgi:hypothetical protein
MRKFIQLILLVAFGTLQAQNDTVTFKVDMNDYTGSFTTVNVNGTFNGWCGGCNPMTDANSDGVWEVALPLTAGTIEYKFTLDGWTAQENFSPGGTCTVTAGGFTNRVLTFSGNNTILPVVCYNSCSACTGVVLSQMDFPITWDDATVNYSTGSFGGQIDSIKVDPTDATNTVVKLDKGLGTQTWAGTTLTIGGLANPIPFTIGGANTISVRFWSPDAGTPVLLKVEDKTNGAIFVEAMDTTTVAGGWEILTFDYNNPAPNALAINTANTYDLISLFPNFGTDGNTAGAKTYYVDDVVYGTIVTGMAGVYTIDPAGSGSMNYTSFSAAAADLVSLGVVGACTFNVAAGSYTDTVYLPAIMGTSSTNTIMFDGGDSATTSLAYNTAAVNQKAVILMDGADYVTFKGLTITHPGTADSWGIRMQNDNDNLTVDGCRFEMAVTASTSSDIAAIASTGSSTSSFTETEGGDNTTIINSAFINGQYGVHFEALAAFSDSNFVINNNSFEGNYYRYFMSDNTYNMTMNGNTMTGMPSTSTSGYGVALYDIIGFEINNNVINASDWGIYIADGNFDGAPPATSNITNNMITSLLDEAFYVDDFESANVFYNSFATTATSTSAYGAYFNDCINVDVRNNVFYGNATYAVWFSDNTTLTSTTSAPITLDYNIYYTVGGSSLAYDAGAQADLAAWQLARANNVNSLSGDPIFIDPTSDLHMAGGLANNAATPIASVTMDIDGDMRSATTPDLGADEYLPASCLPVSGVATIMAYADSASIGWIGNNGATATFNIEYGPLGFTPGAGTTVTAHPDSSITITGLMANTDYEIYVTANCGAGGLGATVGPTAFRTALAGPRVITCATGTLGSLLTEEFDNATTFTGDINNGNGTWLYDNNTTGSSNTGPSGPQSGTHYIYVETSGGGPTASMVSPAIDLAAASQNVELSFWLHAYGATIGVLDVGVSTSATGPFTNVFSYGPGQLQTDELDPWQNVGVNLDAYLGQTIYIEFLYTRGASFDSDLAIDLVEVKSCLSCLTPSALTASNITSTTADITWTSGASNLGSTVEYGPAGFTPGTGTLMTATAGAASLTGLMSAMAYDVYVTDSCGAGDISASAGPISFTTLCPASFLAPYSTDFENITLGHQSSYENCWTTPSTLTPRWEAEDASGSNENSSSTGPFYDNTNFGSSGGYYMYFETSAGSTGSTGELVSPAIDISTLTVPQLDYYVHMYGATMGTLRVYAEDTAGARTLVDSITGQQQTAGSDAWIKRSAVMTIPSGVYRFVFEAERGTSFTGDISIDDMSVIQAPTCFAPSALGLASATTTSADVYWTPGNASNWIVEYGPTGFTPGSGTVFTATNDTVTISGLTAATLYDFYVTDSCAPGDVSTTSGPFTFATSICSATNACVYTLDLFDSFGDGWNGGEITVWQAGIPVGTYGSTFTSGSSVLGITLNLCDGIPTYVTLSNPGAWSSEMGFELSNPLGALQGAHSAQSGLAQGDTLASFTTDCSACPALVAPFMESFDLSSTPACWSQEAITGGPWNFSTSGLNTACGSLADNTGNSGNYAWMDQSSTDNGVSLIMPAIDISALTTPYFEFYYSMCGAGYTPINLTIIEYWDGSNWASADTLDFATNGWQLVAYTIPTTWTYNSGNEVKLRFRAESGGSGSDFNGDNAIDDVRIYEAPTCFPVSNLALSNVTAVSLDVTWTDNGSASYGVIYGAAGFDPATAGTLVTTTNDTLNITGLSPITTYDVYVYSDCGMGDVSDTLGPVSTTTGCAPIIPPSLEDFSNGWTPNACWDEGDGGTPATGPAALGLGGWSTDGFANNGTTGAVKINLYNLGDADWMLSPQYDLGTGANLQVEFDFGVFAWNSTTPASLGSDDEVQLLISTDNGATWVNLATYNNTYVTNASGNHEVATLYTYTGVVQFAIWATEGVIDDPEDNDIFVDNFEVRVTPACPDPAAVLATNITSTDADITWTSSVGGVGSSVEYGPAGFTPGTGTLITSTTDSVHLSGLMSATAYDVYVTDSCGASGVSTPIGPITFTTLCPASFLAPYSTDFENITLGHQGSYENCWSTPATTTPRWESEDATGGNENSTGTGPFYDNTNFGSAGGTYMYLETSSGAAGGKGLLSSPTIDFASLTAPQLDFYYHMYGATMGVLRIYAEDATGTLTILDSIVGQQQTAGSDAWIKKSIDLSSLAGTSYSFVFEGERGTSFTGDISIDDFSVAEAPNCFASTALTVISTSDNSAELTWTAGSGTSWDIEYGPAGFTPGSGTMFNATNDTITISGLMASTAYEFYVTDSCGASGVASTAGPASFTTSACPLADQCAYTVDLYDSFGDGWNGGEITIFQNGVAVASFGSTFSTGFNSLGNTVNLCDNVPTTVTLSTEGAWPSEIGVVVINPNGDTAGVHLASPTVGTGDTLFAFTSNCSACPAIAAPYFESFEANSATVGCWSNVFVTDTFSWTLGTGSTGGAITGAYAGSQNAVFVSTNGGPDTTLFVSPVIDMTALISPQLSFWYAQEEWFGDQNVTNVYYRASASDPWTFLFGDNANRNTWTQALVSLPNPSSTYQIAIEGVNNWGHANVIDSLSITDAAQVCTAPDSVAASNITTTNADITWVSGSNQSSSWIEYGPLGFTPGTGMILNPATTPATLSGLMPGTIYEACVYDICSVLGDTSAAACVTFTTLCAPITMYPYSENFDMGIIPACYASTGTTTGPFLWAPDAGGTPSGATGPSVDNTTGTGAGFYMYTEASSPAAAGDSAFLELPEFNLTSLTVPEISYFYHMFGADIQSLELEVYDATTMTWSSINSIVGQQQTANGAAWMEARVDLSAYVTSTNLRMRFLTVRGASFNGDVALDDITVRETPACVDPTNLMVTNATSSSISLSWMSDTNIVSSTIEYGPIGFSLGTGTQVTATPSAFTVTGLASGACFEFYVRDSCSSATAWIGPVNSCTIATCSVSSIPVSATSDTTDCDGGSVSLSAVSSTGNDLVWLNNGQAVSTGANFVSDSISFTTAFDVAEFVTTTPVLHVGPLTNIAAAGFGNFSNGQWITVNDTIHIDSMVVRHNNDVVAQVVLWTDDSFSNLVQLGDTFSTPAATVGDLQVPVNMVVTPGVYFMNLNFISGAGQLFRATGGAAYPYSLAGLMSIDSTNFADQSRIYYTFDMTVSKACIGTSIQGFGIVPGANAGLTDTVSVCSTESMVDLTSFLGVYDFGGTWTDLSTTGALTDSIFDATAVTAGASYDFSYILAGVNGCAGDTALLNVTVEAAPDAGADSSFALCIGSGNVILRTYITGNPFGGTWVDLDNSGALNTTGVWRSNVATAGTFRVAYILSGTVCAADTAILTITSDNAVSAGIAVSDTVCDQNAMVDLNTFLDASATTGGTWSDLSSTGALSANMFDATAVTNNSSYDFQYKVMSACGDDSIVVTLYVDDCDVSVRELSTGFINIYPNPTSGLIKIEDKAVKGEVRVELYSANGQLMMSKNFGENEGMSLDITDYATGIYTVKVNSEKGLDVKRIIKQ